MHYVLTLDDAGQIDDATRRAVKKALRDGAKPKHPDLYGVTLHNDDLNTMEFVVHVIRSVFGYGRGQAAMLMLQAHLSGKSVLWIGPRPEATEKADQMIAFGPDPARVRRGAGPLRVTVEPVPTD